MEAQLTIRKDIESDRYTSKLLSLLKVLWYTVDDDDDYFVTPDEVDPVENKSDPVENKDDPADEKKFTDDLLKNFLEADPSIMEAAADSILDYTNNNPEVKNALAVAREALKHHKTAEEYYEVAKRVDPSNSENHKKYEVQRNEHFDNRQHRINELRAKIGLSPIKRRKR